MEQRAPGTLLVWANPFTNLRVPKIFNIRTDPYERADITSNTYYDWLLDHAFLLVPAQAYVGQFLMGSKNQANSLKRRHRLTWLFICFRGPRALKDNVAITLKLPQAVTSA